MIISAKTKTYLRLFHKYIGFIFSLFILKLTITGIMLLYPKFFNLNDLYVSSKYILKKYNMLNIDDAKVFGSKDNEVVLLGESLYFKKVFIDNFENTVKDAIFLPKEDTLAVIQDNKIKFFSLKVADNQLEIIDINEKEIEEEIIKTGRDQNENIIIQTDKNNYYLKNQGLVLTEENIISKSLHKNLASKFLVKDYLVIHQGKGVPLHRIITELHNGKIMGSFLSYLLLLTSISLLFLIFSSFFFGINIKKEKK